MGSGEQRTTLFFMLHILKHPTDFQKKNCLKGPPLDTILKNPSEIWVFSGAANSKKIIIVRYFDLLRSYGKILLFHSQGLF